MVNSASKTKHASLRARENRVAIRKAAFMKGADLIIDEEELPIAASVLDSSKRGLRLYVDSSISIPKRFKVILSSPPATHDCELVWQNGNEIGLQFIF